jgi:hypothetical protein
MLLLIVLTKVFVYDFWSTPPLQLISPRPTEFWVLIVAIGVVLVPEYETTAIPADRILLELKKCAVTLPVVA